MDCLEGLKALDILFQKLINSKKYPRGPIWDTIWPGWEEYNGCIPALAVVYLLGKNGELKPEYIGETTNLGDRLNDHFYRLQWDFVQFVAFENSKGDREQKQIRLLLERFAILVLEPKYNIR